MPGRSKRKAPAAAGKLLKLVKKEEQPKKTMADLPPEVVTIVLDHLIRNEKRNNILGYRLVNSQWNDIVGPLLEKRLTSGDLRVFPRMRVHCPEKRQDLLHISQSPSMFPADSNPFPFNSLILDGYDGETDRNYLPKCVVDIRLTGAPDFMSRFGGFLTSFGLQDVILPGMNSVFTLLSPLTSLRVLSVQHVGLLDRMLKPNVELPKLPPLPNLTSLVIKSRTRSTPSNRYEPGEVDEKSSILYIWLMVSYADQLLYLDLDTAKQLPALQRQQGYVYIFPKDKILTIARPSNSAFQNLKKLKINRPSHDFLRLSELPKLQQLTVTNGIIGLDDFLDVIYFISKCRDTLKKLRLDVDWKRLIGEEASFRVELEEILRQPDIGNSPPKLKTLEINYSMTQDRSDEAMISMFLVLFPALETLHFLRFPSYCIATARELETINRSLESGNLVNLAAKNQIVAAKTRLASMEQRLFERTRSLRQQIAFRLEAHDGEERDELKDELEREMRDVKAAAKKERAEIFKNLAGLGVKRQDVVLEQFLERHTMWNSAAVLSMVSFSSGEKPEGDVCIFRRPNNV